MPEVFSQGMPFGGTHPQHIPEWSFTFTYRLVSLFPGNPAGFDVNSMGDNWDLAQSAALTGCPFCLGLPGLKQLVMAH